MTPTEKINAIKEALRPDLALDAYDNLLGAYIDLQRIEAVARDGVCLKTIERVLGQIGEVHQILRREK